MSEPTMFELPRHGREQAAPALTARMLATNAGLALLALAALFLALLRGDAERNTAPLVLGGLAFVPALWVFTTGVAALRKAELDAQTLLERPRLAAPGPEDAARGAAKTAPTPLGLREPGANSVSQLAASTGAQPGRGQARPASAMFRSCTAPASPAGSLRR